MFFSWRAKTVKTACARVPKRIVKVPATTLAQSVRDTHSDLAPRNLTTSLARSTFHTSKLQAKGKAPGSNDGTRG